MAPAIDITDERGLGNKVHHELLVEMSKLMLYLPFFATGGQQPSKINYEILKSL